MENDVTGTCKIICQQKDEMNLQILFFYFVTTVTAKVLKEDVKSNSKWLDNVIKSLNQDSILKNAYQIMLITINENQDQKDLLHNFQKHLPTWYFNASFATENLKVLYKFFQNPRSTTLFVIAESPTRTNCTLQIEETMALIKELSLVSTLPKCLIIRYFNDDYGSIYAKLLQKMWKDNFFDVTILDVFKKKEIFKQLNSVDPYAKVIIHQLNPFISHQKGAYREKLYSGKTPLFPDKHENLNGFPLKVGIIARPPFSDVKRNSTKHPVEVSGPDAFTGRVFSELLNFKQTFVPSDDQLGIYNRNMNKSTGLLLLLQKSQVHFVTTTAFVQRSIDNKETMEHAIFAQDQFIAIIPVLKVSRLSILVGRTFYYSILLTVLIVITSWIIQKLLRFDKKIWNMTLVIKILFGVSVPQQPQKIQERITFICFVIVYFYYSVNIFASLTDFNLYDEEEIKTNSLNDLVQSNLKVGLESNTVGLILEVLGQDNFTDWVQNNKRIMNQGACIEYLIQHKNISCITKLSFTEWVIGHDREKHLVKFIPEHVLPVATGFLLPPASPYVAKFEKLYKLLVQAALFDKWKMQRIHQRNKMEEFIDSFLKSEVTDKGKIEYLLIGIVTVGFLISILTFFAELLWVKVQGIRFRK